MDNLLAVEPGLKGWFREQGVDDQIFVQKKITNDHDGQVSEPGKQGFKAARVHLKLRLRNNRMF